MRNNASLAASVLLFSLVLFSLLPCIQCVDEDDYSQSGNPAVLPIVTDLVHNQLKNLSTVLTKDIKRNLSGCIKDVCVLYDLLLWLVT